MILYIENPKVFTRKLLKLRNKFYKSSEYRLAYRNLLLFYILMMNYQKENSRKKIPFTIESKKNKIPRNKLNQGGKGPIL